jgi:hypothetical protein
MWNERVFSISSRFFRLGLLAGLRVGFGFWLLIPRKASAPPECARAPTHLAQEHSARASELDGERAARPHAGPVAPQRRALELVVGVGALAIPHLPSNGSRWDV